MSSFNISKEAISLASGLGALTLALCLSVAARAQQDPQPDQAQQQTDPQRQDQSQQQQDQAPPPPQAEQAPPPPDQQQAPPPDSRPKPKYAPQDADKPPYANDYPSQSGPRAHAPSPDQYDPDQDLPPQDQNAPAPNGYPQNGPAPNQNPPYPNNGPYRNAPGSGTPRAPRASAPVQPPPATLTIPAGTILQVRINDYLSSDHNQVGDRVTATLQSPIVVNGYVVARRGQALTGQVEAAQKAGRVKGTSQLGIELTDLTLVDGQQRPILTELWKGSGGTSHGADAATIGGTTALGAAIGAAAGWGTGAAIGAGAGAAAGIGAVLLTRGRPTIVGPETPLSFRIVEPVTVDTTQSQHAFLPVGQQDYDPGRGYRGPRPYAGGYPPQDQPNDCGPNGPCYVYPGYAYPAYAYPPYGYYPGYYYPYVGIGYGWGYYGRGYYGRGYYGRGYYGGYRR
jgi:hypothetical protein